MPYIYKDYKAVIIQLMKDTVEHHKKNCQVCKTRLDKRCPTGKVILDEHGKTLSLIGVKSI